jgi:DNA-binding CsgD family transcriptional regulator
MESNSGNGPRIDLVLAAIFLLVVVGGTIDLVLDRPPTLFSLHVAFEVLMVLLSLGAATYLGRGWYVAQSQLWATAEESARLRQEREEWEDRAAGLLSGLSSAISDQFDVWSLTPTEGRVALMLLKGLSHKRIARTSDTSERTVRQHSVSIYRKSGLSGRAELAGFFLENLFLPADRGTERRSTGFWSNRE